ncbi:hypothetical protein [Succinimonas amylolytica]|uniref:hypothetical protein n=1 Tax=Succinimonas amylolytica TaxID=83769 RepID=UPI00036B08A2|nr:hypothetical protein [Succinimonas amylolytica]
MNKLVHIYTNKLFYSNTTCRLVTHIEDCGEPVDLFFEVEIKYAPYLVTENADAIIYLLLMYAIRKGISIKSEVPVTSSFMYNIKEVLIPSLLLGDNSLHNICIDAPLVSINFNAKGVGTGVSCGVDSFYTIMTHTGDEYTDMKLSHLFISSCSIDLWKSGCKNIEEFKRHYSVLFNRYYGVSKDLNLPLVVGYSNYMEYIFNPKRIKIPVTAHHYNTMANVLSLRKLWKTYYFSSAEPFTSFNLIDNSKTDTSKHELLSMHILAIPGFNCYSTGCTVSREEKTIRIADYPIAQKYLHPCFRVGFVNNCSNPTCSKCLRALLTLDLHNKLLSFKDVFDIDKYSKNRIKFFIRAFNLKDNEYISNLYVGLKSKYPKLMEQAEHWAIIESERKLFWRKYRMNILAKHPLPNGLVFGKNSGFIHYRIFLLGIKPQINFRLTYSESDDTVTLGLHCDDEDLSLFCVNVFNAVQKVISPNTNTEDHVRLDVQLSSSNYVNEFWDYILKVQNIIKELYNINELKFMSKQGDKIYEMIN